MFEALQQQAGAKAAAKACRDRIRELDGMCGSGFKEIRSDGREFTDPMTKLVMQRDRARQQFCIQMQKYLRILQTANTELESVQDPEFSPYSKCGMSDSSHGTRSEQSCS